MQPSNTDRVTFREAYKEDLPRIIELLADDPLGSRRDDASLPLDDRYAVAFDALSRDPNQVMAVAEQDGDVIGCLQLSFIPGLTRKGAWRGQIEGVRIAATHRGKGFGREFFAWAIGQCQARDCALVQLSTDLTRPGAKRFYESLGFEASHVGMKLIF
jgi:ribosomal protein S18 acetylase RimI-like enzyme